MDSSNSTLIEQSHSPESTINAIISAFTAMSGWELIAVILAIAYLLLAMRERIECWYAAFASTLIYLFIFWDVNLLMESALQLYYLAMAAYGWVSWRKHNAEPNNGLTKGHTLEIKTWDGKKHALAIGFIVAASSLSGYWLDHNSQAALPYLDSLTTWGAVVTTYMVTQKVLENWLYWIIIDSAAIYLYWDRALYLTVILFVLYVIIAFVGYKKWKVQYNAAGNFA